MFNDLYHLDVQSIGNALELLVDDESIVYAAVLDHAGQTMSEAEVGWDHDQQQLGVLASRALLQPGTVTQEIGRRYLAVAGPIAVGSERIGTLEIVFDRNPQQAFLSSMQNYLLAVLGGIFFVSVLIGIILTRYATRPLSILSSVAEKIGQGDLDASVPIQGSRETAALGTAIDRMRSELKGLYLGLEQ